jgi:putative transposase
LNENWFGGLPEAKRIIEAWRIHYNERRPHSSLGYLTPAQYGRTALLSVRGGALRSPEGFAPRPLAETTQPMIQTETLTL